MGVVNSLRQAKSGRWVIMADLYQKPDVKNSVGYPRNQNIDLVHRNIKNMGFYSLNSSHKY